MASLENKLLKNIWKDFLKLATTTDNTGVTSSLVAVEDGNGNDSALQISTLGIKSTGTLEVTGVSTLSSDSYVNGVRIGLGAGNVSSNTAIGNGALNSNTTGYQNSAMGENALYSNTTGYRNSAMGRDVLYYNTTGNYNSAMGERALHSNTTGYQNSAMGVYALYSNTTGYLNSAMGRDALYSNTTGYRNSAMGEATLFSNTTGSNNTGIGFNAQGSSATVDNEITLGNSSITALRCQVTLTVLSDKRDKTDIENLSEGIEFVKKLNPVSFTWNTRDGAKKGIKASGFIAQELLELQNNSPIGKNLNLVYESNPEKLEATYGNLIPVLVKAIQDLSAEIEILKQNQKG